MDLTRRAFALGSLALLGSACASSPAQPRSGPKPLSRLAQVRSGTSRRVALGALTATQLADAQRSFGVDLLGKVCAKGKNTTVSPASAALAVGLLTGAARGDTEKRLSAMLHLPGWGDDVVAAYAAQRVVLTGFADQLQVSNRCYTATGNQPDQQTLDDWATGFEAVLTQLDLAGHPEESTDRINADVAKDTARLIPKLFEQPLDRDTLAVLVNAVHLKADWVTPFEQLLTADAHFVTDTGRQVTVRMMSGGFGSLRDDGGWQSVTRRYVGDHLEMVAILPPDGAGCGGLTADRLTRLARGASTGEAELAMPKLDVSQTHELLEVLAALGLPVEGKYDGIGCDTITEVVQKDVLRIDEKGTEAAAATGIVGVATGARFAQARVVLDRPYFLLLQDVETGTPLFLSHVVDPSP